MRSRRFWRPQHHHWWVDLPILGDVSEGKEEETCRMDVLRRGEFRACDPRSSPIEVGTPRNGLLLRFSLVVGFCCWLFVVGFRFFDLVGFGVL